MSELVVFNDGIAHEAQSFKFSGGELQVQLPGLRAGMVGDVTVLARLQSADSVLRLLLATEILERLHSCGDRTLVIPYFPYARQDRVMQPGEAFSLKAVVRLINGLGFDRVITCDPHSDVTAALVDKIEVVSQLDLVRSHGPLMKVLAGELATVVSPDAGAAKKAFAVAQNFGVPLLIASKVRDVSTGAIVRTDVHAVESIAGRHAIIVDDICDGGRTFIELAKVLRAAGAAKVFLFVSHGIISQGLGVFDGLLDGVFTTDSFWSRDVESPPKSPVPLHVSRINFNAKGIAA